MFGYIDPGTGSLVIQALIAAVVGSGFYFRQFIIHPIVSVWRFISRQKSTQDAAAEQPREIPVG
jgi:hypothetical protein